MMQKNITNFMGCDAGYEEAKIVLFGAPFDSTTSFRPGTRFAGQVMILMAWSCTVRTRTWNCRKM